MGSTASAYFSPARGAADVIVGFIDRCERTLDVAVFNINHRKIVEALGRCQARGVRLRVLADADQARGEFSQDERLRELGIELRLDTQPGFMHNKFAVGDGGAVITGSFNWTSAADNKNAENFVILRIPEIITAFQEEFERIWALNASAEQAAQAAPAPAAQAAPKTAPKTAPKKPAAPKTAAKKPAAPKTAVKKPAARKT